MFDVDLDAKFVLSNKLVDDLKCENESLKMQTKCLIAEPIAKNEEVIFCNHVVKPDFVPIMSSISKDKSMYIHAKEIKKQRERLISQNIYLGLILGI